MGRDLFDEMNKNQKNVLYKNYAKKDTILIEFKSSYHL